MSINFPDKKYNIIYADPAWKYGNKNTGGSMKSGAANHYDVMTIDDIKNMPIDDIAAEDCVLFMWWVGSMPKDAIEVCEAWGFTLKTMTGFAWVKKTTNWKDWFGMGFWTRQGTENILIGVRGKPKRIMNNIRAIVEEEETIQARAERHSKKPNIFRQRIVELMGDLPRIELFAREKYEGWESWGNEL